MSLIYADRCQRYARQRGWVYDESLISIDRLTPAQRKRALKKERHAWPLVERPGRVELAKALAVGIPLANR